MSEFLKLNTITARERILACFKSNMPVLIHGDPGTGKSQLTRQCSNADDRFMIDFRVSDKMPVDLRGMPQIQVEAEVVKWLPMDELPFTHNESKFGKRTALFLDEFTSAPRDLQSPLYQLINDRRIGEHKLSDDCRIIGAGNMASNRAIHVAQSTALNDRWLHFELVSDVKAWQTQFAVPYGMPPVLRAFINFVPDALNDFDPKRTVNSTSRGWERVGNIIKDNHAPAVERDLIHMSIGDARAAQFAGFARVWRDLPDVSGIFDDPCNAPVPTDVATLCCLATALANMATAQTMDALLTYLKRMPREYAEMCLMDATSRDKTLCDTSAFIKFRASDQAAAL